jgi:hypothetical protein
MGLLPKVPDEVNMVATQQIQVDSKVAEIPKEERERLAKAVDVLLAIKKKKEKGD